MAKGRETFLVNLIKPPDMNGPVIFFFLLLALVGFIVFIRISKDDMGIVSLKGNNKKGDNGNNSEIIFNNIYSDKKPDKMVQDEFQEEHSLENKELQEEEDPEVVVEKESKEMK